HDMDYIASHYRMDLGLPRPPSQGFSRWRNQETSFDELQAEIDVKGWQKLDFSTTGREIWVRPVCWVTS
ncbi:MAG: hypothetical protein KAW47_02570, partial [Thermoplasmatales archaeon]|nr:hypothetical protein [Thermoplasmatales archaeon]